jgi:hypothetical protein
LADAALTSGKASISVRRSQRFNLEGLVRTGAMRDYAEIARRGRATRARLTQIMRRWRPIPEALTGKARSLNSAGHAFRLARVDTVVACIQAIAAVGCKQTRCTVEW